LTREISPAQHAVIRQQLVLIPLYIWVVYVWSIFFTQLPVGPPREQQHLTRDFLHFYVQGVITNEHDAHALYDIGAMAAVADRVLPVPKGQYPPVYGPQVGLIFSPLAKMPYTWAMLLWLALTIVLSGVCAALVWRVRESPRTTLWTTVVLALGMPGLHFTLSFGQASLIGLACFTVLWLALRRGRMFVAGLAVGALAYKPQLGIVAAFVFVLGGEWRVVSGAVAAIVVQLVASVAYWGGAIIPAYIGALLRLPAVLDGMEPDKDLMHSWRSLFLHAGLPPSMSLVFSVVLSVVTIGLAVACWRTRGSIGLRYVVLVMATLLVNPHLYAYDLLVLAPTLLVAWDWANENGDVSMIAATSFVFISPIITVALPSIPLQWSVLGFVYLTTLATMHLLKGGSALSGAPVSP